MIPALARDTDSLPEFTFRAVFAGVVLGIVFGAANAYLGLRVGLTVSASIPAAVLTVAAFRAFGQRASMLEANMSQTVGSASTSLATGTIFTIPALFLWGVIPPYLQVVTLCFLGAILGISAMIPLRRSLIVEAHGELPYPEGTACAEVLRATAGDEARAKSGSREVSGAAWIFRGMLVGIGIKLVLAVLFLFPSEIGFAVPILPKAQFAVELAPALLAVGYILGYRQSGILVAGSIISSFVLIPLIAWLGQSLPTPLAPEATKTIAEMTSGEIWSRYVRYIGAGAVATAGILTVLKNMPSMVASFAAVARSFRAKPADGQAPAIGQRTDTDLPGWVVLGGISLVVLAAALIPGVFGGGLSATQRAVCAAGVGVFGVLFVAVAARIVGIVGVSSQPTSGITLVTLLGVASVFAAAGWTEPGARAAVLTVGTIVAIAASKAGDISQDLKTGFLVGATPARQQFGQLIGASVACWAVAGVVLLLGATYGFGNKEMPAPQATLMKTIIEGVLAGSLPWSLVLTGAGLSIGAMLCGVSGLAFAIGVYLPLSSMFAIYVGGCARALAERGRGKLPEGVSDPGILGASGLVAGEGLAGILVALLATLKVIPKSAPPRLGGVPGEIVTAIVLLGICGFLVLAARSLRLSSSASAASAGSAKSQT